MLVVGAGRMAKIRTKAFLSSGKVSVSGVCSQHLINAKRFAKYYGCSFVSDNYQNILNHIDIDFVLIEVPHDVQQKVSEYFINNGVDTFIGGVGATNVKDAEKILLLAKKNQCVVEAGLEAKYKDLWIKVKEIITSKEMGDVCHVQSCALFPASKGSWYYSQEKSGGMLETHFTYGFLSIFNWLFGKVVSCNFIGGKHLTEIASGISEDSAVVSIEYSNQILCSSLVSYISPEVKENHRWYIHIYFSEGLLKIYPSDENGGKIVYISKGKKDFFNYEKNTAFSKQALNFINSVESRNKKDLHNTPDVFLYDCSVIEILRKKK